jgi:predicted GNAT family acetyltransferase
VNSVRLLSGADAPAFRRLLATDPIAYAMVSERLRLVGVGSALGAEIWGWFPERELAAGLYLGANVVPVGADDEAVEAFASRARMTPRRCSSIVGPSRPVVALYEALRSTWGDARDVRPHQPMLAVSGPPLVAPHPGVRCATMSDIDALFPASVAMFTEELGISPLVPDGGAAYRRRVASLIQQGRAFVLIEDGEVVFKAEVGVIADDIAQVQGVWVEPGHRGRHLSESGMAAVVEQTRQRLAPTVSLYVNDYNHAALASYHRVGFVEVGEFATVLF